MATIITDLHLQIAIGHWCKFRTVSYWGRSPTNILSLVLAYSANTRRSGYAQLDCECMVGLAVLPRYIAKGDISRLNVYIAKGDISRLNVYIAKGDISRLIFSHIAK